MHYIKRELNILFRTLANHRVLKQDRVYRLQMHLVKLTDEVRVECK